MIIQKTKEGFPLSLKFFECFQLQIMSATKTIESLFLRQRDPPKPFPIIFADDSDIQPFPNLLYYHENNDTHIVFILTLSEIIKYNLDKQIIIERCNYPSSIILSTWKVPTGCIDTKQNKIYLHMEHDDIWISFDIIKHKLYSRWNDRVNEG